MGNLWWQRWHPHPRTVRWLGGSVLAIGSALLVAHSLLAETVQANWRNLGFDGERVVLLTSLTLALLGAMSAGFWLRARGAAWAGGSGFFLISYLIPFVWQANHPLPDALGRPQVVVPGALGTVVVTLSALALVTCGVGAVVGAALSEVLVVPVAAFARLASQRWRGARPPLPRAQWVQRGATLSGGLLVVLAVWLCVQNAGDLLTYGPSTPIFRANVPANQRMQGHGTLRQGTYLSPALDHQQRSYWMYLPPSYGSAPGQRYPVLYLLHGSPGLPSDWFKAAGVDAVADDLLARHQMREVILVGADGNGPRYRFSEWANSADGRQRMEDAIAVDLVTVIDQRYRTRATAADRAIGGLSMGGFGAVNIALHHPEVFGAALSLGGYFTAEGPVFGTQAAYRAQNSPALFIHTPPGVQAVQRVRFIIGVGRDDGTYYQQGLAFAQAVQDLAVPVTVLVANGGHAWRVWAQQMAQALPLLEPV